MLTSTFRRQHLVNQIYKRQNVSYVELKRGRQGRWSVETYEEKANMKVDLDKEQNTIILS